jgi:hypothetical protein
VDAKRSRIVRHGKEQDPGEGIEERTQEAGSQ